MGRSSSTPALVPVDENAFCVFSAASPTLVEEAYDHTGIRFERIVDALEPERGQQ